MIEIYVAVNEIILLRNVRGRPNFRYLASYSWNKLTTNTNTIGQDLQLLLQTVLKGTH